MSNQFGSMRRKLAKQYKLVVISTGTAAMVAAMRARSADHWPQYARCRWRAARSRAHPDCRGSGADGLGIPGEKHLSTSEQFLELESLPERIVFDIGHML